MEPQVSVNTINMIRKGDIAYVKGAVLREWLGVVRAEERSQLLRSLVRDKLGTKDVENFIFKQRNQKTSESKAKGFEKDRELVEKLMQGKLEDGLIDEVERRKKRSAARQRLEHLLKKRRSVYKRYINWVREKATRLRRNLKTENSKKIRMIRMSWKEEKKFELPDLLARYRESKVFRDEAEAGFKPGEVLGPVIVGEDTSLLSRGEVAILTRGPKFTIRRILDRERFILEMEKVFVKLRWALKDRDIEEEVEYETMMTEEEKKRIKEISDEEEVKSRSVFDHEKKVVDFRKSRCTDVKHNAKIYLPGPLQNNLESELEMRRVAWGAGFDQHVSSMKDEDGIGDDNLTAEEARGLKSLKEKVRDGKLLIVQTDKSSRFAVMTMEEYERAGKKHTMNDEQVELDQVIRTEAQINGHMSMLMKTLMVGKDWGHQDRTRSTKITHSLAVAPMYILFKDHKLWSVDMGTAPPSRPVASAGSGANDNMSETVSQALEPVANMWRGGMEANSTCDLVDKVENLNEINKDKKLEEIDLGEIDAELDRLEMEKNTPDCDTMMRHDTTAEPHKNEKNAAKQDLDTQTKILTHGQTQGVRFGLNRLEMEFCEIKGKLNKRWGWTGWG